MELDELGKDKGIPNCVLEARPLCENFPQLLHTITLCGVKPPNNEVVLSYMPPAVSKGRVNDSALHVGCKKIGVCMTSTSYDMWQLQVEKLFFCLELAILL